MKMFFKMALLVLLLAGLAGCEPTETTTTTAAPVTVLEQISTPDELALDDTTLSWEDVANADGYDIYANGVFILNVAVTSCDVASALTEGVIFTVVAKAATGYRDSACSNGIGWIADTEAEIEAIDAKMDEMELPFPYGFATALVRRGMSAADFADLIDLLFDTVQRISTAPEDGAEIQDAISDLLGSGIDYGILIGALVEMNPDNYDATIATYETYALQQRIYYAQYQNRHYLEIAIQYEKMADNVRVMKNYFSEDADALISAFTAVADYLNTSFLSFLDGESAADTLAALGGGSFSPAESMIIVGELIAVMQETLPSVDQFATVYRAIFAFANAYGGPAAETTTAWIDDYAAMSQEKLALQLDFIGGFIAEMDWSMVGSLSSILD
ncbi:MAG: hypothetical protein V1761_04155, partial [bacterium]